MTGQDVTYNQGRLALHVLLAYGMLCNAFNSVKKHPTSRPATNVLRSHYPEHDESGDTLPSIVAYYVCVDVVD